MENYQLLKYVLFLLTVINAKPTRTRYVLIFRKVNCTYNPKIVHNFTCHIEKPNNQHISMLINYAQDIRAGYMAHLRIDLPRPNLQIMNLLNLNVDACKFLSKGENNNIVKLIRQAFDAYGNYTECPLLQGVTYGFFNFTIDLTKLPYAPESDCLVSIVFTLPPTIETARVDMEASLQLSRRRPLIKNKVSKN